MFLIKKKKKYNQVEIYYDVILIIILYVDY